MGFEATLLLSVIGLQADACAFTVLGFLAILRRAVAAIRNFVLLQILLHFQWGQIVEVLVAVLATLHNVYVRLAEFSADLLRAFEAVDLKEFILLQEVDVSVQSTVEVLQFLLQER